MAQELKEKSFWTLYLYLYFYEFYEIKDWTKVKVQNKSDFEQVQTIL